MTSKPLSVIELFAGVGGFRLGLEKHGFEVIWSNQWEPSTKTQHASMVYEARFGAKNHSNYDIETVPTEQIPDADILCGGFPCQDYSVATTLVNSKGLKGKKGVLWWSIYRILEEKRIKPKYLILENVDRLLKSPASQRGRDFAVMLQGLNQLGYAVEWRVVNAADYGMPQRRRRVFFVGYHCETILYKKLTQKGLPDWCSTIGILAKAFPHKDPTHIRDFELKGDLVELTQNFNQGEKKSPFENAGVLLAGQVYTYKSTPLGDINTTSLGEILEPGEVAKEFYISTADEAKWKYLKGAKKEERITQEGYKYKYSEGGMIFPDALDQPSRTIITGEGGKSPSRFKHVIQTSNGLRRLTPIELERLNMFPDNHTQLKGISNTKRAFFMGNALVVGVVERIAKALSAELDGTL